MELRLDPSVKYGIVLEGGGARGAYQIGAWKALQEAGIAIGGISGASVGALNGALMCMDDLDRACHIWENLTYSKVMNVSDALIEKFRSKDLEIQDFQELGSAVRKVLKDGGLDVTPLKDLIEGTVDEERIRASERELFVITYSLTDWKKVVINIKELSDGAMSDALLASAYFPAFKREKLGGKRYMDGGSADNVPIEPLLERGYKNLIVIRIYGLGRDSERFLEIPEDVAVYHIAPRQDLGGILEFSGKKARKLMTLGYYDAMRSLYGLEGRSYYLDASGGETYYFDRMMSELELLKLYIRPVMEEEDWENLAGYRSFTEQIFPHLARKLGLKEDWDYRDLYLTVLEEMARKLRVNRFHIYTAQELSREIQRRIGTLDSRLPI